jgi:hypothetical protein
MRVKFIFEPSLFDEQIKQHILTKKIQDAEFFEIEDWTFVSQQSPSNEMVIYLPTFFLKDSLTKNANVKSMVVSEVRAADLAIYDYYKKQRSVYFFWKDCLQHVIQSSLKLSSGNNVAYITYTEGFLKPLVNAMFKLGISKFKVISCNETVRLELLEEIKRINFQIQIDLLPLDQMVGLSGDGILLINTWSDKYYDEALHSLAFFNFLDINSVIINFVDVSPDHVFKTDAKEEGIKLVDFLELKLLQLDLILSYVQQQFKI